MPKFKADLNLANEISEDTEVSNIQTIRGNNTNMMAPLMRCKIDTMPAAGRR